MFNGDMTNDPCFVGQDEKLEVEVCDLKKIFCRYVKGSAARITGDHWGNFLHVFQTALCLRSADGPNRWGLDICGMNVSYKWKVMKSDNEFCKWWYQ